MRPAYPATVEDYRSLAAARLPRFLFDYLDGGAGQEETAAANRAAWSHWSIRQRVLCDVATVSTRSRLLGQDVALPLVLAPVGLAGMFARRGEVQAARAAAACGVPFSLSTVGICGLEEVARATAQSIWFQLYVLRDRPLVERILERAEALGVRHLVVTVDLARPGLRHRDTRHGLGATGLRPKLRRLAQVLARPRWLLDVGLCGRPHNFGNLADWVPEAGDPDAFRAWIDREIDPSFDHSALLTLRRRWRGALVVKGILDPADARAALDCGADGLVVSNHGGRQLDGVPSTAAVLPSIVAAVGERLEVYVDGGIRSGADLFRALALGAKGVWVGRPWAYALAAGGAAAVRRLLEGWRREFELCMALAGVNEVAAIGRERLTRPNQSPP